MTEAKKKEERERKPFEDPGPSPLQVRSVDDPVNKNSKMRKEREYYDSLETDEEIDSFEELIIS